MAKELKKYQEDAIEELILKIKTSVEKDADGKAIVFKSPTGSGKTFTMSQYIKQAIEELREMDICFCGSVQAKEIYICKVISR